MDALEEILVNFRTEEDAVRQGLIKALRASGADPEKDIEHGGIVFYDPERKAYYLAGGGPMRGQKDRIHIRGRRQRSGDDFTAVYHTHPSKDRRGEFSGDDTTAAAMSGVRSYIGLDHDQTARIFDPAVDKIKQDRRTVRTDQTFEGRPFMGGAKMAPEDAAILALLKAEGDHSGR